MSVAVEQRSLSAIVEDFLDMEVDPDEMVEAIVASLDKREMEQALREALPAFCRQVRSRRRSTQLGQSKWSDAAAQKDELQLFRLTAPYIGKPLGDLSANDCDHIAKCFTEETERLSRRRESFRTLAKVMRTEGAATLADLGAARVRRAFSA